MGMFDSLFSDENSADLVLAAGLLGGKGNLGSILSKSLLNAQLAQQGAQQRTRQKDLDLLTKQRFQIDLDETTERKRQQQALRDAAAQSTLSPAQVALSGGGGPTIANLAKMPASPQFDETGFINRLFAVDPLMALQQKAAMAKQAPKLEKLSAGERGGYFQDGKWNEVVSVPEKAEKPPADWQLYQLSGAPQRGIGFDEWNRTNKRAGATNVSMNTGEKGFKNELDLKKDFKGEPAYKDYTEMQSSYKQIKAGIAAGNPIGDVAAATKVMKLLDPGSVVRESELGIAMAATGRIDRMKSLYDLYVKGEKLTPSQRKEFGELADELFEAAGQVYNQKHSEYEEIGKRYQLNTTGLGPKHKSVKKSDSGWKIERE